MLYLKGVFVTQGNLDLVHFKKKLLTLREEIEQIEETGDEAAETVELDQSAIGRLSRMDALQGQAMAKESQQRRKIQKQRIEATLQRMEKNEFGWCAKCWEEINPKRLEVDPTAPLCIDCANQKER